jgi:hypothetical protein
MGCEGHLPAPVVKPAPVDFVAWAAAEKKVEQRAKTAQKTEMRDAMIELLTLLEVLGSWDRFKKGYRPANAKLWQVVEKLRAMI